MTLRGVAFQPDINKRKREEIEVSNEKGGREMYACLMYVGDVDQASDRDHL